MPGLKQFSLEGKVTIVTGASRGIGRATALAFAKAGSDIVLTSRKVEDLEKVAEGIRAEGRRALAGIRETKNSLPRHLRTSEPSLG